MEKDMVSEIFGSVSISHIWKDTIIKIDPKSSTENF